MNLMVLCALQMREGRKLSPYIVSTRMYHYFILVDFFCRGRRYGEDWLYRLQKELTHEYDLPKPLAMMEHGEPCEVVRLSSVGPLRIRLLEMGLVPGTTLTLDGVAPLGDPLKIRVRGIELSLRKSEATTVWVRPLQKGPMKGRS